MHFDESFPKRVAIARAAIRLTQDELAKKVGIVRRQIAAYEGGEARPRDKALQNLAAALGTTTEWLASGKGSGPNINNVKRTITLHEIPVLDHMQVDLEREKGFSTETNVIDFIPSPPNAGENAFAVKIEGNSMTSTNGISFPVESIVTFDPDIEPKNGDFVLCALYGAKLLTFKKLIHDQGALFLGSLNPAFPAFPMEDCEIVGVAIHTQMFINRSQHAPENEWHEIEAWDSSTPPTVEHSLMSRIENIEEKLDSLFDLLSNKKPT